jgi:hypothetical protein
VSDPPAIVLTSPRKNDGNSEREYADGFGSPGRKEWAFEAALLGHGRGAYLDSLSSRAQLVYLIAGGNQRYVRSAQSSSS